MKKLIIAACLFAMIAIACQKKPAQEVTTEEVPKETYELLGYESKIAYGEHLVTVAGCDDCHSPKVMTENGPEPDMSRRLSGHHEEFGYPDVDRKMIQSNGLAMTNQHFTAWIGPWGVSFTGNLTSDPTGIGNWEEENFRRVLREGKFKGIESGRPILPPMPWPNYAKFTDDEISAIFAFLKSTTPIQNVVIPPIPPAE